MKLQLLTIPEYTQIEVATLSDNARTDCWMYECKNGFTAAFARLDPFTKNEKGLLYGPQLCSYLVFCSFRA